MKSHVFEIPELIIKPPVRALPNLEDIVLPQDLNKAKRPKRHSRQCSPGRIETVCEALLPPERKADSKS